MGHMDMPDGAFKLFVYLVLAADHKSGSLEASAHEIADDTCSSYRTTRRHLSWLEGEGYISLTRPDYHGPTVITVAKYKTVADFRKPPKKRRVEFAKHAMEDVVVDESTMDKLGKKWREALGKPVDNS